MYVYRLEHGTHTDGRTALGRGPMSYDLLDEVGGETGSALGAEQDALCWDWNDASHPSPFRDYSLAYIRQEEACGTTSWDDLVHWFGENRIQRWVERFGFVVRKYEVPDEKCRVGKYGQVLFEGRSAVRVEEEETT